MLKHQPSNKRHIETEICNPARVSGCWSRPFINSEFPTDQWKASAHSEAEYNCKRTFCCFWLRLEKNKKKKKPQSHTSLRRWSKSFFLLWTAASLRSVYVCVSLWGWQWQHVFSAGWEFCALAFPPTRRGESEGGSWKWPCHMGNYSTLRSERTHKRPHYLQLHCRPAWEETESLVCRSAIAPLTSLMYHLYTASDASPFFSSGNIPEAQKWCAVSLYTLNKLRDKHCFVRHDRPAACFTAAKLNPFPKVCSLILLLPTICA